VKVTAEQLADYYETENSFAMKNLVSMIELLVTMLIVGALVFLTLLSSETAGVDVNKVGESGAYGTTTNDATICEA